MKKRPVTELTITTRSRSREEQVEERQEVEDRDISGITEGSNSTEWQSECGQRESLEDTPSIISDSLLRHNSPSCSEDEGEERRDFIDPIQVEQQNISEMAEARAPFINPKKFRGTEEEDVEEYLAQFERASKANGWDDNKKLVVIPCYLEGAALRYYENTENRQGDDLRWNHVKEGLRNTFQSIAYDEQLEYKLRMRMQRDDETVESYVQDVLYLCSKVDPTMSERSKIKYVLRGLKPSMIEKVMPMKNDTLDGLMTNLRTVQTARYLAGQRVDHILSEPRNLSDRESGIKSALPAQSQVSDLERKIENLTSEFAKFSMRLMTQQNENRTYDDFNYSGRGRGVTSDRGRPERGRGGQRGASAGGYRGGQTGRTRDGRVICFRCGRPGHFAVACRSQESGNANQER